MNGVIAVLILVLSVSVRLDFCDGVQECKYGDARHVLSEPEWFIDRGSNGTCPEGRNICGAVICTKAGLQRGFSRIIWGCFPDLRGDYWAETVKKKWYKDIPDTALVGIECRTEFGEMKKNFSNVHIKLPEVPKGLQCLYGEKDADGNGNVNIKECLDDDHQCFTANCAEGNGHVVHTELGCSFDTNSTLLTAKVGKFFNLSVPCEFLYGKKDTDLSNTDLIKTTTTTTEKLTTSTTTTTTTTPKKTSTMTTPDTNVDFGEGRKTGLLCVLDKICTILFAKEKNGTAKPSRRFAPHLVKESGKCKNLGYEVKAGKDQVEKLGNELSESIQKVGLVFVDDYILAIE
uniref:EF-hand domain-containing protein n=1 Tax=Globodera pallida TaxID=36090 RepID=A0A183BN08_GLOPA